MITPVDQLHARMKLKGMYIECQLKKTEFELTVIWKNNVSTNFNRSLKFIMATVLEILESDARRISESENNLVNSLEYAH
jgi:hypothetical protein